MAPTTGRASAIATLCLRRSSQVEQGRNDSHFIDFAEFFHDFADRRTEYLLGRSSIANRCADNKEPRITSGETDS
jgi:hypothetical protein